MTEEVQAPRRRIDILDYARLAAAVVVVAFHWTFNGINNGKITSLTEYSPIVAVTKYGYLGVELFFLISGFVILNSARGKTARQFAVGRAVRLYPAFWLAICVTTAFTLALGHVNGLSVTATQVAVNATMVPSFFGVPAVDGVYWTLVYELEFYAAVFLVILIGQGRRLGALMPWWALAMAAVAVVAPSLSTAPLAGGYFALFASGAIIAEIKHHGPSLLRAAGLAASFGTSLVFEFRNAQTLTEAKGYLFDPWVVVAIVAVFHVLILSMCLPAVANLQLPAAQTLGALTYPLYLLHAHIGYMLLSWLATSETWPLVYAAVGVVVVGLSWAVHVVAEKRPLSWWFRFFDWLVGAPIGILERRPTGRRATTRA